MPLTPANRARCQALLAVVGMLLLWWRVPGAVSATLLGIAGALALLAFVSPRRYAPVQRGFDAVIHALLVGLTWTALGLVYLGVFTPLRLWRLLTRQDPLNLRRRNAAAPATYLRPLRSTAPRFDRQF